MQIRNTTFNKDTSKSTVLYDTTHSIEQKHTPSKAKEKNMNFHSVYIMIKYDTQSFRPCKAMASEDFSLKCKSDHIFGSRVILKTKDKVLGRF